MSNETQTTPTDIMPIAQAAGMTEYPVGDVALAPYAPGPVITAADADNLTIENVQAAVAALTANDGAPASPLLTREEMAEPLAPFPDATLPDPLPNTEMPAPFPTDEANWPPGIAEELAEANAQIAAIEARAEPAPEREKVWNINLQAWV